MSVRHAAAASMATTSFVSGEVGSSVLRASSTPSANDTLPLSLRILRFTVRSEKLLFQRLPGLIFRISGLQTLAHSMSDVLGIHVPLGEAAQVNGPLEGVPVPDPQTWKATLMEAVELGNIRSLGGMFNFLFSRWAFACLAMALILNRINVYASSRQRIFLTWEKRLAIRIVPILLFLSEIHQLLRAIRCQSSPDFSFHRYGISGKEVMLDWSTSGGWLHTLASVVLYGSSDENACRAVGMAKTSAGGKPLYGSFSLLWPTFLRVCLSQVVETISCCLQQLPLMTETGMSVFEHSLAFAEAETMLYSALGLGFLGSSRSTKPSSTATTSSAATTQPGPTVHASATVLALTDAATSLSGPHILDRMNVPPEVLLIALLSCCNSLSSHIIAVFNRQRSLRLINTGIWALCFMSAFIWGFFSVSNLAKLESDGREGRLLSGLLHFPTVCILGFTPHLLILIGLCVCTGIYALALLLTALSLASNAEISQPTSLIQRFAIAHDNLQAALQVKGISVKWHEDVYTALLRIGFIALTAASEAVFLNEGRSVEMRRLTWLEEDRLDEVRLTGGQNAKPPPTYDPRFHITEEYGLPPSVDGASSNWQSGYAKERKLKNTDVSNRNAVFEEDNVTVYPNPRTNGVGAVQRSTRFYLLYLFWRGILFLMGGWAAYFLGLFLDRIGVTARPGWLKKLVGSSQKRAAVDQERRKAGARLATQDTLDFWYLSDEGELITPDRSELDIEHEMRRRIRMEHPADDPASVEQKVDEKLYQWWKMNGWWGTRDDSGDYRPPPEEDLDDTTSVVSDASTSDEREWESDSGGRQTPTRSNPFPATTIATQSVREASPFDFPLDPATLVRLLNPPDRASKEEARILASHLSASESINPWTSQKILTRSHYRREVQSERARVLFAGRRHRPAVSLTSLSCPSSTSPSNGPLTPTEESNILESLILSRRQSTHHHPQQQSARTNPAISPAPPPSQQKASSDPVSTTTTARYSNMSSSSSSASPHTSSPSSSGPSSPLCVVCQSCPRTIIAWPCRCLCVCEDCRVSLALNNFGNCVTCRRSVSGFVRLWVP